MFALNPRGRLEDPVTLVTLVMTVEITPLVTAATAASSVKLEGCVTCLVE
jgi:hypothetical protein